MPELQIRFDKLIKSNIRTCQNFSLCVETERERGERNGAKRQGGTTRHEEIVKESMGFTRRRKSTLVARHLRAGQQWPISSRLIPIDPSLPPVSRREAIILNSVPWTSGCLLPSPPSPTPQTCRKKTRHVGTRRRPEEMSFNLHNH